MDSDDFTIPTFVPFGSPSDGQIPVYRNAHGGPTWEVPASGGDLSYTFTQSTAATTWTITHNLGKRPSVSCFEDYGSGGIQEIEGQVVHISEDQLTVSFNAAVSGFAYLN